MGNNKGKVQVKAKVKAKKGGKKKFTPTMSSGNGGILVAKLVASIKDKNKKDTNEKSV